MVWFKRLLTLLALGVAVYLFWPLLKEIRSAGSLFTAARWQWLPLILLIQVVSYAFLTWLNMLALQPFPGRIGFFRLMALLTSMAFIEVAVPSAGASGVALRARLLEKQGRYSVEVATFTLAIETIVLSAAMASVGVLGIIYLFRSGNLGPEQIVYLLVLAGVVALLIWSAWRFISDPRLSHRALHRLARFWNWLSARFHAPDPASNANLAGQLDVPTSTEAGYVNAGNKLADLFNRIGRRTFRPIQEPDLDKRLSAFQDGLVQLRRVPAWKFILGAYARVALDVATLGACFVLFGYTIKPGALLTGYALVLLASGLAALPGGLGMADLSIPGLFLRLGVPGNVSLVAGLSYRLIAFWLLRFIGFLSWQYLEVNYERSK